jgi:hypothetical protein
MYCERNENSRPISALKDRPKNSRNQPNHNNLRALVSQERGKGGDPSLVASMSMPGGAKHFRKAAV